MLYLSKIHAAKPPRNQQPYEWCDRFLHILNSWNYPRHTEIARNWTGNSAPADPLGRWCLAPAKFIHCRESTMYKYIYINIHNYPSYAFKKKCSRPRFWQRRHQDTKRMTSIGVRGFQRCATCWGLSSSELLELSFWRWREDGRMGWVEFTAMFWRIKLMGGWW